MKDQDFDSGFPLPLALLIIGICFVGFYYVLQKLNEDSPRVFLWVGIISLITALLCAVCSMLLKQPADSYHEQADE